MEYQWIIEVNGNRHEIKFFQTGVFGRLTLQFDGKDIQEWKKLLRIFPLKKWFFSFLIGDHVCVLTTEIRGFHLYSVLTLDGESIEPSHKKPFSPTMIPMWLLLIESIAFLFTISLFVVFSLIFDGPYSIFKEPLFGLRAVLLMSLAILGVLLLAWLFLYISTHATGHQFFRWTILILSSWLFLSSMFLWAESNHETIGMFQSIRLGISSWMVLIPILCGLIMLIAAMNIPGGHILLYPLGLVMAGVILVLNSPAELTRVPGLSQALGWRSSIVTSLLLMFSMLLLAIRGEFPPLNSWLARIQYLGAYHHYVSLYGLAFHHQLMISEPTRETNGEIYVKGMWRDRQLLAGINRDSLIVSISSFKVIWPFRLLSGYKNMEVEPEEGLLVHQMEGSKGQRALLLLWPPPNEAVDESRILSLASTMEKGRKFIDGVMDVSSGGESVDFHRMRVTRLPQIYTDFEGLISWLLSIAQFMEDSGYVIENPEVENNYSEISN
jgi:hypothetical protein